MTPATMVRRLAIPLATAARRLLADRSGLSVELGFYLLVTMVLSGLLRAVAGPSGTLAGYSDTALTSRRAGRPIVRRSRTRPGEASSLA